MPKNSFIFCLQILLACIHAFQLPFFSPNRQEFSVIGIIDVGAGPTYRDYKRYLSIHPLSAVYSMLHDGPPLTIRSLPRKTTQYENLSEIARIRTQSQLSQYGATSAMMPWTLKEITVPDVTDLVTVTTLAQIAYDAYIEIPDTLDWVDVNKPWNLSSDFGWQKNGLRGHVFSNKNNETIIISLKGTSPAVFWGGTGGNDKINVPRVNQSRLTEG